MKSVLFLVLISISTSFVHAGLIEDFLKQITDATYSNTQLSSEQVKKHKDLVEEMFKEASGQTKTELEDNIFKGYGPKDMQSEYYEMAYDLYIMGYARLEHLEGFEKQYNQLLKMSSPPGADPVKFWWNQYKVLFDNFFDAIKANPQVCAGVGVLATAKKCCSGLVKQYALKNIQKSCLVKDAECTDNNVCCSGICKRENTSQVGICADPQCIQPHETCNTNGECCSGVCRKTDLSKPGRCQSVQQCYKPARVNENCDPLGPTPFCLDSVCTRIDLDTTGLGECLRRDQQCKKSEECCSGKCENNKCVDSFLCKKCASNGSKPEAGEECCDGYLDSSTGKCRILFRPGVNANKIRTNKSIFKKIFSFILPSAHAASTSAQCSDSNQTLTQAQQDLLDKKQNECAAMTGNEKERCLTGVEDLKVSYCKDNNVTLTDDQQAQIDDAREKCVSQFDQGSTQQQTCLKEVTELENNYREGNTNAGINHTGTASSGNRFDQYINKYKAPTISAKTYSDAKNCYFNSYNDNWKSASNVEKNAELFLRSFEYVFVGNGTQDYWEDKGKGNVFKRANRVAKAFRKNRQTIIERTKQIDKEITCKCIAIWGPEQFSRERQEYFQQNCNAEAQDLSEKLASGDQKGTSDGSNVDGTTIKTMNELSDKDAKIEKDAARMEEIDKGAIALSHEKLLIEFLGLRSQAKMDRFVDNQELEKELEELSEFISGTDFKEVWKDKVQNNALYYHSPPGDSRLLYKWGYTYKAGFFSFLLLIILIVVGAMFLGPLIGSVIGGAIAGGVLALILSGFNGSHGEEGAPGVHDIKKVSGAKYSKWKKWDGFERWYVGPLFDNYSNVGETKCRVYAKASACFKSAYSFVDTNMKYLDTIPPEGHFIVDPKRPPFVDASKINIKTMPIYNKTWVQIMNETVDEGVHYLKTEQKAIFGIGGSLRSDYERGSKGNLKDKVMEEAYKKLYFIPYRGKFKAQEFTYREAIVKGATKYAMCKELFKNPDSSCNGQYGTESGDVGFGYLFEDENEAKEWGEYTYELHYVYSSVTKDTYMGYPLLGMDAYFQAVAFNMKLVGSLSAERSRNYADTARLYQKDWEKRAAAYQSLGEGGLGSESKNLKYRGGFHEAFEMLNFSGSTNVEEFDAVVDKGTKSGKFNSSELAALNAGRNKALRSNKDLEKKKAFEKDVKNVSGAQLRLKNQSRLASTLQNPINAIVSRNPNGSFKNGQFGRDLKELKNDIAGLKRGAYGKGDSANSGAANYQVDLTGIENSYNATSAYGSGSSEYNSSNEHELYSGSIAGVHNQGMSVEDAQKMVNALGRDESLSKVNEADTLWTIVSKAYRRNYSRVLYLKKDFEEKKFPINKPKNNDKEKEELRKILQD